MPELICRKIELSERMRTVEWATSAISEYVDVATGDRPVPGDIFFAPHYLRENFQRWLAKKYLSRPEPRRPPIVVVLPGMIWFCVDWAATTDGDPQGDGWDVVGDEPPNITVSPSINVVGAWHGWLQGGVLRW